MSTYISYRRPDVKNCFLRPARGLARTCSSYSPLKSVQESLWIRVGLSLKPDFWILCFCSDQNVGFSTRLQSKIFRINLQGQIFSTRLQAKLGDNIFRRDQVLKYEKSSYIFMRLLHPTKTLLGIRHDPSKKIHFLQTFRLLERHENAWPSEA